MMSVNRRWSGPDVWAWCVVGIIALHTVIFGALQIYAGDDICYAGSVVVFDGKPLPYLRFVAHHYLDVNGRMANLLAPFWLSIAPRWMLDLTNGLICGAFYVAVLVMSGVARRGFATAKLLVTALLLFTFPWWDSFMLFDVMFNYVWSSTFVLIVLWMLLRGVTTVRWRWLIWIFAAFAASMHEGIGIPVTAGLMAWLWLTGSWRNLTETQRGTIISFIIGAVFVFVSPGIWNRFVSISGDSHIIPNDPMWLLVLKSDFYVLILLVVIGIEVLRDRRRLVSAARSSWSIFVVSAVVSACFSAVSGIVGRSGWFASLMALIALAQWVRMRGWHINRALGAVISTVLSVIIPVHLVAVDDMQSKMNKELGLALAQYSHKPDEPVYMDYHPWDAGMWITLAKVRGVPECYESYILKQYAMQYASENASLMVVLPREVENISTDTIVKVSEGYLLPQHMARQSDDALTCYRVHGGSYIPVWFTDKKKRQMCYLTPLRLRPGDRMYFDRYVEL